MAASVSVPAELHDVTRNNLKQQQQQQQQLSISKHAEQSQQLDNQREKQAAETIQRCYRGYRTRRELKGWSLSSSTRWLEAVKEAQWRQAMRNQCSAESNGDVVQHDDAEDDDDELDEEENTKESGERMSSRATSQSGMATDVRQKWKLAGQIARRAGGDDNLQDKIAEEQGLDEDRKLSSTTSTHTFQESRPRTHKQNKSGRSEDRSRKAAEVEKKAKMMDLQYFLEMVDTKHRYGSNLRAYHTIWRNSPSKQNFFYWLDYGEGKDVELERVPRDRLEREQVRYLSREERQDYLVVVDEKGCFRWAKNNELVLTDSERFKDSIQGVVPVEDKTPTFREYSKHGVEILTSDDDDDEDDEDDDEDEEEEEDGNEEDSDEEVRRYMNPDFDHAKGIKKIEYVSPAVIFNHLMRKSLKKKDKWIFVADTSFRMYIGIKESGAFQHSSFLRGARIAAAGLLKIKNGQLRSLSPLSGHYRPPAANFRAFVHALQNNGVDMSRVSISRSYVVLVGIEGYMKFKQKKKDVKDKIDEGNAKSNALVPGDKQQEKDDAPDISRSRPTQKKPTTTAATTATTIGEESVNSQDRKGSRSEKTGLFSTMARTFTRRSNTTTTEDKESVPIRGRGIPGTAPEGVPAPEEKR